MNFLDHELLDRVSIINHMFYGFVCDHGSVSTLGLQEDVDEISDRLGELYQKIGNLTLTSIQ